jgi:hypothetical protein
MAAGGTVKEKPPGKASPKNVPLVAREQRRNPYSGPFCDTPIEKCLLESSLTDA